MSFKLSISTENEDFQANPAWAVASILEGVAATLKAGEFREKGVVTLVDGNGNACGSAVLK